VHTVWREGGIEALRTLCKEDPAAFVSAAGKLVPKEFGVNVGEETTNSFAKVLGIPRESEQRRSRSRRRRPGGLMRKVWLPAKAWQRSTRISVSRRIAISKRGKCR
jgi:hypothetical protein